MHLFRTGARPRIMPPGHLHSGSRQECGDEPLLPIRPLCADAAAGTVLNV